MLVISLNQQFIIKTSMGQGECSCRHCIYSIKGPTSNNHPPYRQEKLINAQPLLLPTLKKIDLTDKEIEIDYYNKETCIKTKFLNCQ